MDFIVDLPLSNGYDSIWVVVDRLTKYAHFVLCRKTITAEELASLFVSQIFAFHGLPHEIISDRGSLFTSKFWKRVVQRLNIKQCLSTAFHPRTDGQTERVNQILEQYLRCYCNYSQDNWAELLPLAQFAYNNSDHSSTRTTPFYANHGFHPESSISGSTKVLVPSADNRINHLREVRKFLTENIRRAIMDHKLYFDKKVKKSPTFKVGDKVWLVHHQVHMSGLARGRGRFVPSFL
jgi:transposase InsO family protein